MISAVKRMNNRITVPPWGMWLTALEYIAGPAMSIWAHFCPSSMNFDKNAAAVHALGETVQVC